MKIYQRIFNKEFWSKQNNYILLLCMLITFLSIVYVTFHAAFIYKKNPTYKGIEMVKLNATTKTHINNLVEASYLSDTSKEVNAKPRIISDSTISRVVEYLAYIYPNWDNGNKNSIKHGLKGLTTIMAISYLSTVTIQVESYFWLSGNWAYLEIFFWTLFGVIASLLYAITESIRNKDPNIKFEPNEIPSHVAKLFYAPLISYIIIFSFDYLTKDEGAVDLSVSKSLLVVSFLLGFYSGRAMEMLNRLKELLLPYTSNNRPGASIPENTASAATKKIQVQPDINPGEVPAGVDFEMIDNQVGKSVVKLIGKDLGKEISLSKQGEGEHIHFVAENVQAGKYQLVVKLDTDEKLCFTYTEDISIDKDELLVVPLKLEKDAG